jgi:5-methylthioribose kinase
MSYAVEYLLGHLFICIFSAFFHVISTGWDQEAILMWDEHKCTKIWQLFVMDCMWGSRNVYFTG